MPSKISGTKKRIFIRWFLNKYTLKLEKCSWFLEYLVDNPKALDRVRFIESGISNCPRGILMSTKEIENAAFVYYKDGEESENIDEALHSLQVEKGETFCIMLDCGEDTFYYDAFARVIENNVYTNSFYKDKYSEDTSKITERLEIEFEMKSLEAALNESLDSKDKDRFLEVSKRYTELKERYNKMMSDAKG